jgi:hypothetical protein
VSDDVYGRLDHAVERLGWTAMSDQMTYNENLWELAKAVQELGRVVKRMEEER